MSNLLRIDNCGGSVNYRALFDLVANHVENDWVKTCSRTRLVCRSVRRKYIATTLHKPKNHLDKILRTWTLCFIRHES